MSLNKITVLLVDDHELVRAGFRRLLEDGDKFDVVAEAGSGEQAVQDFAKYHPGGQLGKQLGLVVKDVMHPIREVAILKENSSLFDVAILMTKKPLGAGLFLGKNKTLAGIITEGDIRKAIAFNKKTDDSMDVFINRSVIFFIL